MSPRAWGKAKAAFAVISWPGWIVVSVAIGGAVKATELTGEVRSVTGEVRSVQAKVARLDGDHDVVRGLARLACIKNLTDAQTAGLPCGELLAGVEPSPLDQRRPIP